MSAESNWLTRISPTESLRQNYRELAALGGLDPYGQHKLLWQFFDRPRTKAPEHTAFLFRAELREGLPLFYVLSRDVPQDKTGHWRVEPREYHPDLHVGDRLAFKLRVNPVVARKGETGERSKRHDVVMDAKLRAGWKEMLPDERPSLAHIADEAGACWLRQREVQMGCHISSDFFRTEGHMNHCLKGRRDENGKCRGIALTTMDFEGELQITDQEQFKSAIFSGIGPAKAFGCGLLLVRRI